ncbi:MAG: alpha-L-fucosidase [Planctomycetes bacterium]|nr:alpha-L-fucosidase [Planctomycetota bacterium]
MDALWGQAVVKLRADEAQRGQLFSEGNYAMFIHWGLYSHLANKVDGKTYYGIGEWIKHPRMAGIPVAEYKKLAEKFNPTEFNAMAIAQLAKDAGMKYIIITSKHHDGFAMYHSKVNAFNIVDATPFKRDPMKELAQACQTVGIGFGFYYSHNQDWTFPGGSGGPKTDEDGKPATFDDYFAKKCLPQVEEITSEYGPIELVWFDTPGKMPKKYVQQLVNVVRKNQPDALVSGRAGHGLGDYQTLGDMEVPHENVEGLWEAVDTTNDSWAYAWYDEYWKTPKEILKRVIACVARGGTYMLNIGPRGDGTVPERAARSLRGAGAWIKTYPQVVYGTEASPWTHALPWGDVTVRGKKMFLSVFKWPAGGELYLPGLKTGIHSARLLSGKDASPIKYLSVDGWVRFRVPARPPEALVSVIELELAASPQADTLWGLDPGMATEILADFAEVQDAAKEDKRWMEKFGEWKHVTHVTKWQPKGTATFEVDVLAPGDYQVDLTYSGEGRLVWGVTIEGGEHIQNQQNSSHNYQKFPMGWLNFPAAGRYQLDVSCLEGNTETASLKAIQLMRIH